MKDLEDEVLFGKRKPKCQKLKIKLMPNWSLYFTLYKLYLFSELSFSAKNGIKITSVI